MRALHIKRHATPAFYRCVVVVVREPLDDLICRRLPATLLPHDDSCSPHKVIHAHFLAAPHFHEHIMAGALRAHSNARSATKARTSAVIVQIWQITSALIAAPVWLPTLGFADLVAWTALGGLAALRQSFVRESQGGEPQGSSPGRRPDGGRQGCGPRAARKYVSILETFFW